MAVAVTRPDFSVANVSVVGSGSVKTGTTATVNLTIANSTSAFAAASQVTVYIVGNGQSIPLTSFNISSIGAYGKWSGGINVNIPSYLAAGTYSIMVVANSNGAVAEGSTSNNYGYSNSINITRPNTPPVAEQIASIAPVVFGDAVRVAAFFRGRDVDNQALTYRVTEGSLNGAGYLELDGQRILSSRTFTQAEFDRLLYRGAAAGTETLSVQAYDGQAWGNTVQANILVNANRVPTVTQSAPPSGVTLTLNSSVLVASYFRGSDADNQALTYRVTESNVSGAGSLWLDGRQILSSRTFTQAAHSGDCDHLFRRIATTCSGPLRPV